MKLILKAALCALLLLVQANAHAGEWRIGGQFSIISGYSDLTKQHEDNARAEGEVDMDKSILPIGTGFKSRYETSSGFFLGGDLGPTLMLLGDPSHFEVPFTATVGYSLFQHSIFSPFLRVGTSYHIATSEYVNKSNPGLFFGAGIGFGKTWGIEAYIDRSTVEIEDTASGGSVDIETHGFVLSLFALF